MATVVFAGAALRGVQHFLGATAPGTRASRAVALRSAATLLASHPLAGALLERGLRQLVIGHGATGALALYRFVVEADEVRVLAVAGQRELGYRP
jgi:plasmid stabilization system protein ParE